MELLQSAGVNIHEIEAEWTMLKRDFIDQPMQYVSWTDVNRAHKLQYPNVLSLIDLVLTMCPSSAEAERGFSQLKLLKTKLRSKLSQGSLNDLLVTRLHTSDVNSFNPIESINLWFNHGSRVRRVNYRDIHVKKNMTEYKIDVSNAAEVEPDSAVVIPDDRVDVSAETLPVSGIEVPDSVGIEVVSAETVPVVSSHMVENTNLVDSNVIEQTLNKYMYCSYSSESESENENESVDSDLEEDYVFDRLFEFNRE